MQKKRLRDWARARPSLTAMALALAAGTAVAQTQVAPPAVPLPQASSEAVPPPPGLLTPGMAPTQATMPQPVPPPVLPAPRVPAPPPESRLPASSPAFRDLSPSQIEEQRTAEALAHEQMAGQQMPGPAPNDRASGSTGTAWRQATTSPDASQGSMHHRRARHARRPRHDAASAAMPPAPAAAPAPSDYWKGVPQSRTGTPGKGLVAQDLPPLPVGNPNTCFALVQQAGRYSSTQHAYTLIPSADRLTLVPPVVASGTQDIHVRDAGEVVAVLPAHEHYETERVQVAPPSVRYVRSDPLYQPHTRRMQTQPTRVIWAPGPGKVEWTDPDTGEVFHRVKQVAAYETMTRQVEEQPGQLHAVVEPAQYTTVTRRVIDTPARILRAGEPGQDVQAPVSDVIEPGIAGRVSTRAVDAVYSERRQLQAPGIEWRAVVCAAQLTQEFVSSVQAALAANGYPVAVAGGRFDADTRRAVNRFQQARGLPQDAYLNLDTVRALGLREPDSDGAGGVVFPTQ